MLNIVKLLLLIFLNIGAISKCITYVHFVLLTETSFAIAEPGNIVLKGLFVPRHDLYEKWLSTTFKAHLISASSAITLSDFTDIGELVWEELLFTGSLTTFWSPCWLTVPAVLLIKTMLEEFKSLSFSCFIFFILRDTNVDIPICKTSMTFLLHRVHIAFIESPPFFKSLIS